MSHRAQVVNNYHPPPPTQPSSHKKRIKQTKNKQKLIPHKKYH